MQHVRGNRKLKYCFAEEFTSILDLIRFLGKCC